MDEKKETVEEKPEIKAEDKGDATPAEDAGTEEEKVVSDAKEIVEGMKEANKEKKALLEREEKLQTKKETLNALGGGSPAGTESDKPKYSEEEKAARKRIGDIGRVSGASWAKNYE